METIHAERLMMLARFLYNVLPLHKFNFGCILRGKDIPNETFSCGTVGCAIGWAPIVFPDELRYVKSRMYSTPYVYVVDRNGDVLDVDCYKASTAVKDFFGLSQKEAVGLFSPGTQYLVDLPTLTSRATSKEVAENIAEFVSRKAFTIDTKLGRYRRQAKP